MTLTPYENKVADYVKSTGHHVMYRVTPVFEGDNLLVSGVLMEGQSVEDSSIHFCIFAYNAQPGVTIDYATGDSIGEEYTGSDTSNYDGVNFASSAVIQSVQSALNDAGFDCGAADGIAGQKTYAAVMQYRADKGLGSGGIDATLALALGLNAYDLLKQQETAAQTNADASDSVASGTAEQAAGETTNQAAVGTDSPETSGSTVTYVVNTNTRKFHYPGCLSVSAVADHNRWDYAGSRDELITQGYQPCKRCNP